MVSNTVGQGGTWLSVRRDQAVADIALSSTTLAPVYFSLLPGAEPYTKVALAIASAAGLTSLRQWVVEMPFSLALLTSLGLGLLYLGVLPPNTYGLGALLLLVFSFVFTPSFKSLSKFQEAVLGGEESKDPGSEVVERIYKVAQSNGGISSLAHIFQEINQPELGKPISLKECGRALKALQELGEAYKLIAEGNVFIFPGITALNDPLTKSIVELASATGVVGVHDLILKLNLTPEVAQNALNRLEQFGIAVSKVADGVRLYSVKGLAKHYPYTQIVEKVNGEEQLLA